MTQARQAIEKITGAIDTSIDEVRLDHIGTIFSVGLGFRINDFFGIWIFEDGSAVLIDNNEIANDVDPDKIWFAPNICLQDAYRFFETQPPVMSRGFAEKYNSLDVLEGALSPEQGDAARHETAFDVLVDNMGDPIRREKDTQSWRAQDARDIEELLILALLTDHRHDSYHCELSASMDEGPAFLTALTGRQGSYTPSFERALRIVGHFHSLAGLTGVQWEYNDGARGRRSGYSPFEPRICILEIPSISSHLRLAARKQLHDRLAGSGLGQERIEELLRISGGKQVGPGR